MATSQNTGESSADNPQQLQDESSADANPQQPRPDQAAPPWGSDDQFDPRRAWKLIQDIRGDLDRAKAERDEFRGKVGQFEDASKTEHQRLEERAGTLEQRASKAEADAVRLRVALRKGLTETQARRLVGDTEEQLEADADELVASFKPGPAANGRPQERLRPGAARDEQPAGRAASDMDSLIRGRARGSV